MDEHGLNSGIVMDIKRYMMGYMMGYLYIYREREIERDIVGI